MVTEILLFALIVCCFFVCRPRKQDDSDIKSLEADVSHLRDEIKAIRSMMDESDDKAEKEYEKWVKGLENIMNFEVK